jgi:cytochrome b subunit of formate dehydrogenase
MPADRLVSFDASYHGLAGKEGVQTVANCASCHGVHNILPSSDPKSTINPKNLPNTCGKCHPGVGRRFAIGRVHVTDGAHEPPVLAFVRQFYLLVIPVTIGLMLLHNGGDWVRKLVRARFRAGVRWATRAPAGVRMLPFERVQHAVLALSFLTLVWTGFALKYPDQWWARPLVALEARHDVRSLIHRIAASVFIAVSVTHLVSLIVSRKLRDHWKEMIPKVRDAREASSNFAYNLGLGDTPPPRSSHSYIEKAEYWAVIWGAVVMGASGIMLWANSLVLRFLPKLWLDVATSIHFYEAVLAALAIAVWHFYSVIFDPDVYPLNTAFLTGYIGRKDELRHAPDAHELSEAPGD